MPKSQSSTRKGCASTKHLTEKFRCHCGREFQIESSAGYKLIQLHMRHTHKIKNWTRPNNINETMITNYVTPTHQAVAWSEARPEHHTHIPQ